MEKYKENINIIKSKEKIINSALGKIKADLVLKNATFVNVFSNELIVGDIACTNGIIVGIGKYFGNIEYDMTNKLVLPGFINSHIHLESSLVSPIELSKALIKHGTTTLITDPHEIANVMGIDGIKYMLQATKNLPIDVFFMLPSCVPAAPLEESGAQLDYTKLDEFYENPRVLGLAEFMDSFSIINCDNGALNKLNAAQYYKKHIDGHAPMLEYSKLNAYIASGVESDHECYSLDDALTKLRLGQYIMIREGTAAQNLEALTPLLTSQYSNRCMFCVDDRHPNDIQEKGDIDYICKKAIKLGVDPIITTKVASINAANYFNLNKIGAIAPGYQADFVVIDNFTNFNIEKVFKKGELVFNKDCEKQNFTKPKIDLDLINKTHNTFHLNNVTSNDFKDANYNTIGMVDGEILTTNYGINNNVNVEKDILKIAVVERHHNTNHIGNGYIHGYGLKSGAVATSIAHDSHNIIVVGTNASDMAYAVNYLKECHGGIVVVNNGKVISKLVLEIAGLMTDTPIDIVCKNLNEIKKAAFNLGVNKGIDPFMTLSFMSLPVIPDLRITTHGMFDVNNQKLL